MLAMETFTVLLSAIQTMMMYHVQRHWPTQLLGQLTSLVLDTSYSI